MGVHSVRMKKEVEDKVLAYALRHNRNMSNTCETLCMQALGMLEIPNDVVPLLRAAKGLIHLHNCEQEGLSSGMPTPKQWYLALNRLQAEIENVEKYLKEKSKVEQI